MQINENSIIELAGWIIATVTAAFLGLVSYIWRSDRRQQAEDRERIRQLEIKVSNAITEPEVKVIVDDVKREFRSDHAGLAGRLDRVETGLRQEIRVSHDSLQSSLDKVVSILLTRDESDRRRRGE